MNELVHLLIAIFIFKSHTLLRVEQNLILDKKLYVQQYILKNSMFFVSFHTKCISQVREEFVNIKKFVYLSIICQHTCWLIINIY